MKFQDITVENKSLFNKSVSHPLQSFEWGQFRQNSGVKVIRRGVIQKTLISNAYQLTVHKAPLGFKIGYLPKGNLPAKELVNDLRQIGKQEGLVYILLEPNVEGSMVNDKWSIVDHGLRPSFHPLFTKYSFILDLEKTEDELLASLHPKTRYNIKVAQKHGVEVKEDNSDKAFKEYLRLTEQTTKRQKFYAHDENYRRNMWQTLKTQNSPASPSEAGRAKLKTQNSLTAHLFTAVYRAKILTTWIVFVFKDQLYYPYGASSEEYREVMANNLMAWEVIKYGKKLGLKKFDMWGALGENPNTNDPWYGFHRFKKGYGAKLVEFVGSYDLVINPLVYRGARFANKARWAMLKARLR